LGLSFVDEFSLPMSDPSESAPSAPDPQTNPPAESPQATTPPAALPEEASSPDSDEPRRKGTGVRIGTQRYGVKAPLAVAKPVLPAPPPELLAKAQAASVPAREGETIEGEEGGAARPRKAGEQEPAPAEKREKPAKKPRTLVPLAEPAPPRKYPPPNLRSQLSPDLQMEYLEAIGGESLEEMIAGQAEEPAAELASDSRHKGEVIAVHRDDVFVEIGGRRQGVIPLHTFAAPPEVGATLDVVVASFDPAEGLYQLALPGAAVDVGDWSEVAEGMIVEARITGHNKGGLECEVAQLRGFIPASQISLYRVEDLSQFEGQKFACVVTEANAERRKLVLSRRAVLEREQAEAKEKLLASLEVGQTREGTVRSLQNFGAFVDLGGVDGLIHISQLSWDRIKHASEVLELGQKVKVKIQKIDPETGKIGLAFRDLSENPWSTAARDYPAKTVVKGRVTRLTDFGAFVRLGPGVEGLVHVSELSHKRVFRVSDAVSEGEEVSVMVLSVDPEAQRIGLSMKALEAKPETEKEKTAESTEPEPPPPAPKKRQQPLRGGIGGPPTGERFGLKW
jgi:small subunit ribosomal protein S1